MIVEVVVGLPIDKSFHYSIPTLYKDRIGIGKRVWVPFGQRRLVGYVVGFSDTSEVANIKAIEDVIDENAILDENMLKLTKWMSEYYFCSWGEAIETSLPATLRKGKTKVILRKIPLEKLYEPTFDLQLTRQQKTALKPVLEDIERARHNIYLLYGITASGKTELYLQAISFLLKQSKSSIVLVPEISLTPQTTERFKSRFGDEVSVIHSRLSEGVRFREWQKAYEGKCHVVIGPRSAIFSPVKNLGLIIIDEEHETSYKQEDSPRYHARDVAIKRAQISGAIIILGSATPSLESYYNAKIGNYKLLKLTERVLKRTLPKVRIIDMRKEFLHRKKVVVFSLPLQNALAKTISEKKQAILFLNRRGFATHLDCKKCGYVMECKRCKSVLVYHSDIAKLVCHYCNKRFEIPRICPSCESTYIKFFGLGTQKVESELHRLFPEARIARMDTDATMRRGAHERILEDFKKGTVDVIVGTQMIAKGLDFPQVTLVGVVSADISLNLPDFRASERTFDLLTQVAGRAGRGEEISEVIIQTYAPTHYAIVTAARHDYEGFYKREIQTRRFLGFPPFYRIIKFTFKSSKEEKAKGVADDFSRRLKSLKGFKVIGPAPSPIIKVRSQYRWNVFLKFKLQPSPSVEWLGQLKSLIAEFKKGRGAFMVVDGDPISG
ncbi:MAG: primosomal protein N' [Candidatus Omnitrophica bacterium]|nr:primosomal protein N' [Candidatus Omnitrophota bacterium]